MRRNTNRQPISPVLGSFRAGFAQRLVFDNSRHYSPNGLYADDQVFFDPDLSSVCKESGGELLTSPYVIDVIGDPHGLHQAMVFKDGPFDQLRDDGAAVEITELETIDIESVVESDRPEFAQPE